jgi:hypothetical protein
VFTTLVQKCSTALVRHALTAAAGWAETQGLASHDQGLQIVAGGLAVVAVGWSWWSKRKAEQRANPVTIPGLY